MGTMLAAGRENVVASYLAWGDPVKDSAGLFGELHFHLVKSEHHERTAVITEHSVETGVAVADHVRPNVDKLKLVVHMSQVPIGSPDFQQAIVTLPLDKTGVVASSGDSAVPPYPQADQVFTIIQALRGIVQTSVQPQTSTTPPGPTSQPTSLSVTVQAVPNGGEIDYVDTTYKTLTALRNMAMLLTVHTPRAQYKNMIIESIEMDRDSATGTGADFTLEFRQIRIVSSLVVDAPQPKAVASKPSADVGKKDPKPATGDTESALHRRVFSKLIDKLVNG